MIIGKGRQQIILLVLIILMISFIWSNSMKVGDESHGLSENIARLCYPLLSFVFGPDVDAEFIVRKCAHLAEYCLLFMLLLAYQLAGTASLCWKTIIRTSAVGLFVAVVDEWIQTQTPGRDGKLSDVLVDLCGGSLAVVFWLLVNRVFRRWQKNT